MKTKSFIAFAACIAVSALTYSCSNEENTAASNGQLTAFTGGIVTEAPMERVLIGTSESSPVAPGFLTRTSMGRKKIGGEGTFYWEKGDVIYVQDKDNKLFKSKSYMADKAATSITFYVGGSYTAKGQYDVYYCGTNSGAGPKKVVIASTQKQTAFNNTKHFGASGDCGVAKATKNTGKGKSGYKFDLAHKASYLCFLPYIASQYLRANYRIQRIEITSNNNIAGTYDLTLDGLSGSGGSKTITLNVGDKGLMLADQNTETKSIKNSLYVVIAPGSHSLKVKYTVLDTKANKVMTMTKSYRRHNFAANKICDIPVSLGAIALYGGHNYYMWDAKENYWFGHEWDSTSPWQPKGTGENENYPESATDGSRWFHEGDGSFEASVNPLFNQLPNANELAWYVMRGDPHWDNSTQWEVFGEKHTGGIWLKKLSVIAQEQGKQPAKMKEAAPNGVNLLTTTNFNYSNYRVALASGKPNDSEINNYFFLPALGYYLFGQLNYLGYSGDYWSSSADPSSSIYAYNLTFNSGGVHVNNNNRSIGFVAQPFE